MGRKGDEEEVPRRKAGLILEEVLPGENRKISGCLPGLPYPEFPLLFASRQTGMGDLPTKRDVMA